jgi:sulfate permease, SulP family
MSTFPFVDLCFSTSPIQLRADKIAPQVLSVVMLTSFYLTDFNLIGFIPKAAFSSMLVLAAVDMIFIWGMKSYFKTREKMEWLVVPAIVILAFSVGLLQSVFVGIALSTFLFVAAFFRSGVVKYISNGINIRSTIERNPKVTRWLDQNADQIQILVLQNYLFFGNATSIFSYITSMFDDALSDEDALFIPPKPKVVILDLTLVTGMDTSAVDVFSDILNQCKRNGCKLFLSGVSKLLREVMFLSGLNPETKEKRAIRSLRFFHELDAAVGKAEDMLIDLEQLDEDLDPQLDSSSSAGLSLALRVIDEEHGTCIHDDLIKLQDYTEIVDVSAGEVLYRDRDMDRGLFFVEHGIMVSFEL